MELSLQRKTLAASITAILLGAHIASSTASEYTIPNQFTAGSAAVAAEVNENFSAAKTAIDDNVQAIADNTQAISNNTQSIGDNTQAIDDIKTDLNTVTTDVTDLTAQPWPVKQVTSTNGSSQTAGFHEETILNIGGSVNPTQLEIELDYVSDLVVTFNAECSVEGDDYESWVDIDILVDGEVVAPTNGDNALCTSFATGETHQWVSAVSLGIAKDLLPGPHTISVIAYLEGLDSDAGFRIDDIAVVATATAVPK